ncbi:MAG: 30S ribosome-binding factor RbfA [Oligoflexia bacterium]|nr:30S ribosome-binding factor RbfA [Oligoflexia bacterium]
MNNQKNKFKKEKYQEEIMQLVSSFMRRQLSDTRLTFISITKIELNNDYSEAKIYWDTHDNSKRGDAKHALDGIISKIRRHLASSLKVRQIPLLNFVYDAQFDCERKIEALLKEEQSLSPNPK